MTRVAVGVDVSKDKSMISIVEQSLEIRAKPYCICHTERELNSLVEILNSMGGELRVIVESTGHYHEPIVKVLHEAGLFVSVVNPYLIKDFGNNTLRRIKTDKADAVRIARYGIHYWHELRQYFPADNTRIRLKSFSRELFFYIDKKVAQQNHLITLLDRTFPGANKLFHARLKANGRVKWVDFAQAFWHCNLIKQMTLDGFTEAYQVWCRNNDYIFTPKKVTEVYNKSLELIATMPQDEYAQTLVTTATRQLTTITKEIEALRSEMCSLAQVLPEFPAVTSLFGINKSNGAQLMAEIGDVRNFKNGKALVAYAGIDPGRIQSGTYNLHSVAITKNGSAYLRRALTYAIDIYILHKPVDEPVYAFYAKKHTEGKHFFVCKTAAINKFLRIYYARVKEYLDGVEGA